MLIFAAVAGTMNWLVFMGRRALLRRGRKDSSLSPFRAVQSARLETSAATGRTFLDIAARLDYTSRFVWVRDL